MSAAGGRLALGVGRPAVAPTSPWQVELQFQRLWGGRYGDATTEVRKVIRIKHVEGSVGM